jgi:radical SAM protein with 4Fe4S-binding SPASM domain
LGGKVRRAVQQKDLFLSPEEFQFLLNKILEFKKREKIKVDYSESGYLGPAFEEKVRDHVYFCQAGISVSGIMVNGDILACPNIDRRFKQGNIFEDSFIDVWENRYKEFRDRSWMRSHKCESCKHWNLCQGNAFHLWDIDQKKTKLCHFYHFELDKIK